MAKNEILCVNCVELHTSRIGNSSVNVGKHNSLIEKARKKNTHFAHGLHFPFCPQYFIKMHCEIQKVIKTKADVVELCRHL